MNYDFQQLDFFAAVFSEFEAPFLRNLDLIRGLVDSPLLLSETADLVNEVSQSSASMP